jgi:hypothetical protein
VSLQRAQRQTATATELRLVQPLRFEFINQALDSIPGCAVAEYDRSEFLAA